MEAKTPPSSADTPPPLVRHFRQSLLWPLQMMSPPDRDRARHHWQRLVRADLGGVWHRVEDELPADASNFSERHYKEFVAFLPHVRRFVYSESRGVASRPDDPVGGPALKVFRRHGVAGMRITLSEGQEPLVLSVAHVDLYFFDDIDVAILNVEVCDLMYRFGRAYPTAWDESGRGVHNADRMEWLGLDGEVLARADTGNRAEFLAFTCLHRAPSTSSHWAFLLHPLVLDPSPVEGPLRYRQIEYHRMPLTAYLALDEPRALTREQWIRIGLIATLHPQEALPLRDADVTEFEERYCYGRYWTDTDAGPNTRFLCTGRAFILVGEAGAAYFRDSERGLLGQFRHQYFLLFLIAHFHRAALLVFSDRLVDAIHDLDVRVPASVRRFQRRIHTNFETFLRFTHRYWFHELSERAHIQALYRLCAERLGNDALFREIKEELQDMSQYLDSDSQRRQSNTIVRLTVVTVFSIVGSVTTGFLVSRPT